MYTVKIHNTFVYNDRLKFEICSYVIDNYLVLTYKDNRMKIHSPERFIDAINHTNEKLFGCYEIFYSFTSELTRRLVDFKSKEMQEFSKFVLSKFVEYYPEMYK